MVPAIRTATPPAGLPRSGLNHFAGTILQEPVCKTDFAGADLRDRFCRSRSARPILQEPFCETDFAEADLRDRFCRSHFAGTILRDPLTGVQTYDQIHPHIHPNIRAHIRAGI
jgi:hypothetical protein